MNRHTDLAPTDHDAQPAAGPEPAPGGPHGHLLATLHRLLRGRYPWAVALGLLGGCAGAVAGYLALPPTYESTGLIQIVPLVPAILYKDDAGPMAGFDAFVKSQATLLKSRRVIDSAVGSEVWQAVRPGLQPETIAAFGDSLEIAYRRGEQDVIVTFRERDPEIAAAGAKAVIEAYEALCRDEEKRASDVRLSSLDERQRKLNAEVKALRERIQTIGAEFGTDTLERVYEFSLQEQQRFEAALNTAQSAVEEAAAPGHPAEAQVPAGKDPAAFTPLDIAAFDPAMQQLLLERANAQGQIDRLTNRLGPGHREVRRAQDYLATVEDRIKALRASHIERFLENAAQSSSALGAVVPSAAWGGTSASTQAEAPGAPAAATQPALGGGGDARASAPPPFAASGPVAAKTQRLTQLLEEARRRTTEIGRKRLLIENLRYELEGVQQLLKQTSTRIDQLTVEANNTGRIHIRSKGDLPFRPANAKKRVQIGVASGLGGAGLGIGLILLLGLRDHRLRTIDDARHRLAGIQMLGILPRLPDDLANAEQAAIAAHCVHQIRTLVQLGPSSRGRQVFVVTGPAAGTGKTSLTLALGLSFAMCGTRTLMIDCDLVGRGLSERVAAISRRRIGRILRRRGVILDTQLQESLHLAQQQGRKVGEVLLELGHVTPEQLAEALELQRESSLGLLNACDGESVRACTTEAGFAQLYVLPAGAAVGRQAGSLSPAAIQALLAKARQEFDVVLVDTGPVPGSLEASIVAAAADGTILVVSAGDQRPLAEAAVEHLVALGARISGLVFNRADSADFVRSTLLSTSRERASHSGNGIDAANPPRDLGILRRFGPVATAVAAHTEPAGESEGADGRAAGADGPVRAAER